MKVFSRIQVVVVAALLGCAVAWSSATVSANPPAAAAGSGTLNLNSIPVSKVLLDGKPLGSTPKVGVSVPAGSHTVTFIHPDLGKRTQTVAVKPGETKAVTVTFK